MKKTILATAVVAAFASFDAQACCGDGAAAALGAKAAGAGIVAAIEASTITVAAWLEQLNTTIAIGFGKVSADIMKQTASQRVMNEGMIAGQTQLYLEKARGDAQTKYQLSPRSCFEVSSGAAATIASSKVAATQTSLGKR